jgi:hypothetical protein
MSLQMLSLKRENKPEKKNQPFICTTFVHEWSQEMKYIKRESGIEIKPFLQSELVRMKGG